MSFTPLLRRIREEKTNYRKRKAILIGKHTFAAVRTSNENVLVQVLRPSRLGDLVLASAHSRELIKHGWKGSRKSMPASYLTGLLAGKKALANRVKGCILYTGMRRYSPKVAAAVKGLIDAGLEVPADEKAQPEEGRIAGKHIADYANLLKGDQQVYDSRFSGLIKEGFAPETYPDRFNAVKTAILGKPVALTAKVRKEAAKKAEPKAKTKREPKAKKKKGKDSGESKKVKKKKSRGGGEKKK